jgi:hypothetical protein
MTKVDPLSKDGSELNRLLSHGRLSGAEYDAVEQRILAQVAPERTRARWQLFAPAVAAAAALALWLGLRAHEPGYAEKGGGMLAGGVVSVGCGAGAAHRCHLGDTLVFSVLGNVAPVYLIAYAEPLGPEPSRIWYFPRTGQTAPRVAAGPGTQVAPDGVRLGPPHVPGRYRVKVWLSESALDREQVAGRLGNEQSFDIDVVD